MAKLVCGAALAEPHQAAGYRRVITRDEVAGKDQEIGVDQHSGQGFGSVYGAGHQDARELRGPGGQLGQAAADQIVHPRQVGSGIELAGEPYAEVLVQFRQLFDPLRGILQRGDRLRDREGHEPVDEQPDDDVDQQQQQQHGEPAPEFEPLFEPADRPLQRHRNERGQDKRPQQVPAVGKADRDQRDQRGQDQAAQADARPERPCV